LPDRIEALLRSYPRERPPLTAAHRERYLRDYLDNRDGACSSTRAAQRLERWMHAQVAAAGPRRRLLELGAGTLNHVPYESGFDRYDIVEPWQDLFRDRPERARVSACFSDVSEAPAESRYDRIFSIAVLEHLIDLPAVIAASARLLAPHGLFQAGIPSEGGLTWGLAWRLVTGPAYRARTGLDYGVLMRHEHVNTAPEILALVRHYFKQVKVRRFLLPWHHLSFYAYLEARDPALA
jgi:SAM-dependent methyltransferase